MDKHENIKNKLMNIGKKLGFLAFDEIGSGQERSSWSDVVWFDSRIKGEWFEGIIPVGQKNRKRKGGKPSLDTDFVLPVVGFEIDEASASPKIIKGSASNLETIGAQVGVIVIYSKLEKPSKQTFLSPKINVFRYLVDMKPRIRIIVLTELELDTIEKNISNMVSGQNI